MTNCPQEASRGKHRLANLRQEDNLRLKFEQFSKTFERYTFLLASSLYLYNIFQKVSKVK